MVSLLLIIGAGYLAERLGMMDEHTNSHMSKMIVNIFNPLLVLSSAASSVGLIPLHTIGLVMAIAVAMFAFFIVAGMILSPLFDRDPAQKKIYQLMFVFSNLVYIGIPVVNSVLGSEYVVYVSEFTMVYNLVFYTYGMVLMDGKLSKKSLKSMINPGTVFGVLTLVVIVFSIQIPDFLMTAITYLGNVASPMALVAVGYTLAQSDLKRILTMPRLYVFSLVKLLILPIIMLPLLRLVTSDASLIAVCMVVFGMPVGNMPLILGTQKGLDCRTCSAAIILSTLLCVFTVPILVALVS
jgi:predicted permease